jgi:hypothetical protein
MPFQRASRPSPASPCSISPGSDVGQTRVRQLADRSANVIKIDTLMEDAAGEQLGDRAKVRIIEPARQQTGDHA